MKHAVQAWFYRLSALGLLTGALLFAASLTPSLLPRNALFQGVLGGVAFYAGYVIAVLLQVFWRLLELPVLAERGWRLVVRVAAAVSVLTVLLALAETAAWQNAVREKVAMPPVDSAHPLQVALISLAVSLFLLLATQLIVVISRMVSRRFYRYVPRRYSIGAGAFVAVFAVFLLLDEVVVKTGLNALDDLYRMQDAMVEPRFDIPTGEHATGSAQSLVGWASLGRAGREYVASAPSRADITGHSGRAAYEPIRTYVGLNSADNVDARADLALRELIRAGGFDRSVLVIATPTGTGWMDPAAFDTLEILHGGDVATVAMQYSYLSSYVSMLVEPEKSAESARALFRRVYGHWTALPEASRPKLYLFGLSLGAYGSEQSAMLFEIVEDPLQGALWAGPPFLNQARANLTRNRVEGSPAWLPRVSDGSFVRFANQFTPVAAQGSDWGRMRLVYLQYASDPVSFFDPAAAFRRPEWLTGPRGPDVSDRFRWYPVVTFLQLLVDMANSLVTPEGYGHAYAHDDYVDAWVAVTEPDDWTPKALERLKTVLMSGQGG